MRRSFLSGSVSAWALCTGWFVSSLFVTGSAESQDFPRPIVSAEGIGSPNHLRQNRLARDCSRELRLPSLARNITTTERRTTCVGIRGARRLSVTASRRPSQRSTFSA